MAPTFVHSSKKIFCHTELSDRTLFKSIETSSVIFSFFLVILGNIDSKNYSKNLKLHVWYLFWDTLQHITWIKK